MLKGGCHAFDFLGGKAGRGGGFAPARDRSADFVHDDLRLVWLYPEMPRNLESEIERCCTVGFVDGRALLDLAYAEDSRAEVDMNVAMTDAGAYVEVQGSAEARPFDRVQLDELLGLAQLGIDRLFEIQRGALDATAYMHARAR